MARKGWSTLSPGYRARLEKAGISKREYEGGQSIREARGHKATPERPTQAAAFPTYQAERQRLTDKLAARKHYMFSTRPIWNPRKSNARFQKEPPSMASMRKWVKFTREEWLDAIRENPEIAAYLGYH